MGWAEYVAQHENETNNREEACTRLIGRHRREWKGNIEMYLREVRLMLCAGLILLTAGTSEGLLCTR